MAVSDSMRLEIKISSHLRLMVNRNDNAAFERSIGAPTRGIGENARTN